ncbi:hypothetical protein DENSPDRAFT_839685 [Dentipellis sp. KUC8613]|nr:hypothetical protein DENSPDRAFT_839685 [Dentipellis sp. KUC8613]
MISSLIQRLCNRFNRRSQSHPYQKALENHHELQEILLSSSQGDGSAPWESDEWEGPPIGSIPIQRQRFPLEKPRFLSRQDEEDELSGSAGPSGGESQSSRLRDATFSPHLDLNALSRNRSESLRKASTSSAHSQMQSSAFATSSRSTRNAAPRNPRGSAFATGYGRRRSSRSRVRFASPLADLRLRSPSPMSDYDPTIDPEPERLLSPPPDRSATPMRRIGASPDRLSAPSPSPPAVYSDLPTPSSSGSPAPNTVSLDNITRTETKLRGIKHVMRWYASSGPVTIESPPSRTGGIEGDVYVHNLDGPDIQPGQRQLWCWESGAWDMAFEGTHHPILFDYRLWIKKDGSPSWVTRKTLVAYRGKERMLNQSMGMA